MKYIGEELDLFQHAQKWKRYYAGMLRPYVRGRVLDAGCGMGVNAEYLVNDAVTSYTFLEPDGALLDRVPTQVTKPILRDGERVRGTTSDLAERRFDTILYLDVIEHIDDAKAELHRAYELLEPGGHLLIVVPAFNFLYSPFDKAIGHFRRYDRGILANEMPSGMERITTRYLDSLGMLMSLGNKFFLKQSEPKLTQVLFWDRNVVPLSRIADKVVFHSFGRSMLSISRKPVT
ncbi:MAG: class I SAM-dependent methyltransferase [Flavobacteriales bacterium]|nr:class I SAM-dependent methyltransferase [Flavobacteriales bacterium]MCC6939502.1 class I SAM-dependent methyltransferase [Flavobacteriales bacterium]